MTSRDSYTLNSRLYKKPSAYRSELSVIAMDQFGEVETNPAHSI